VGNKKLYVSKENHLKNIPKTGLFNPPLIEHPKSVYYIYIPVIILLLFYSLFALQIKWWIYLLAFIGSLAFWTAFEYILHRFVLHAKPKNKYLRQFLYKTHWIHHEYPNDNRFVLMSPMVSIAGGVLFFITCRFLFGPVYCFPVITSLITIYVVYEWMHYAAHNYNFKNPLLQKLKKHHLLHHFKDNEKGFGFITTGWDDLTGTSFTDTKN